MYVLARNVRSVISDNNDLSEVEKIHSNTNFNLHYYRNKSELSNNFLVPKGLRFYTSDIIKSSRVSSFIGMIAPDIRSACIAIMDIYPDCIINNIKEEYKIDKVINN